MSCDFMSRSSSWEYLFASAELHEHLGFSIGSGHCKPPACASGMPGMHTAVLQAHSHLHRMASIAL